VSSRLTSAELTELKSADAYCRLLTERHYENFSVVSALLAPPLKRHLRRIYAFCRTTDDLGDESGQHGLGRLELWTREVEACFAADPAPIHPVLIALVETVRELAFGPDPFLDLIQANVQDQTVSAYETWDSLRQYCMLSAAPVGRMVLRVFGVGGSEAESWSDDVCIGLQLANHAQDVRRDAARGRSYLIQSVVREAGTAAGVRDLCDRAETLLESGKNLEAIVPRQLAVQLALYRLGGMEVVSAIRKLSYRTDLVRPAVSATAKARILAQALAESVSLMRQAASVRS